RAGKGPEPTHHASFRVDQQKFKLAKDSDVIEVPLHWSGENGIEVTKIYRFHRSSYVVEVEFQVNNKSGAAWQAQPYYQLQRTPLQSTNRLIHTFTGGVLYSPEE